MTTKTETPRLSPAQEKMLLAAARRAGKKTPGGNDAHFVVVGTGQAQTAKKLTALGYGAYALDEDMGSLFWIWSDGVAAAREIHAARGEVV